MPEQFQLPPPPAPPALEQTVGPLFQGLATGLNTLVGTLTKVPADIISNLNTFGQQAAQNIQVGSQQVLAAPLVAMQTTQAARGNGGTAAPPMPAAPLYMPTQPSAPSGPQTTEGNTRITFRS